MRNGEVAALFGEMADLLEMSDETDRFRPISYRRAARAIEDLGEDIEDVAARGGLEAIPGVGKAIAAKIREYLKEGRIASLERLRASFPPGLKEIMDVRDIGPKTARRLYFEMKITSLDELKEAAASGKLRRMKGFGPKTEENILKGIELAGESRGRSLLGHALPVAEAIVAFLEQNAPVDHAAFAGSLRRMRETVGDLDVLVSSTDPAAVHRAFTGMPEVRETVLSGETKTTVLLRSGMQADLRVVEPDQWGAALQYFTGSKDHNVRIRAIAQRKGLKLNEYGLFRDETRVAAATEEEVYAALGLPYIPPELREDTGEIDVAAKGALPELIRLEDIRGDLHAHTNVTDGVHTMEEMAAEAQARGYEYLGISDHSPFLRVANGLSEDNLRIHVARIRAFNERTEGFRLLAGTECDILADGTLDYPDRVLRDLDYVIGSIHSNFKMPQEQMTRRVVRAMRNEHMDILSHPTARKIGQREPIALDFERVFDAAMETGTALEVNAYPDRTDLSAPLARAAKERGVRLIVDTDSHATEQLAYMRLGVGTARRAWLERDDVLNTRSADRLLKVFGSSSGT